MRNRTTALAFLLALFLAMLQPTFADTPAAPAPAAPAAPAAATAPAPASTVIVNNPAPAAPAAPQTPVVQESTNTTSTTIVDRPVEGTHGMGMAWIVGGAVVQVALVALVGVASSKK